jgi:hypothetical protein
VKPPTRSVVACLGLVLSVSTANATISGDRPLNKYADRDNLFVRVSYFLL